MKKLLRWLNWVLMADLFFVLLCFGWFAVAVAGRSTGFPLGLTAWYSLWEPVMQPALGVLMAGALATGLANWVANRFAQEKQV
ncbi:MAG TPA: hypothetical protein V6D18_07170 [Thermosynechococcaceae cyanobacterium]